MYKDRLLVYSFLLGKMSLFVISSSFSKNKQIPVCPIVHRHYTEV